MEELFLLISKTYGIAGLILLAPFVGLVTIYRHNLTLQKQVFSAKDEVTEAQKQRVKDAQDISNKLLETLQEQTALNTETNIALERVSEALNNDVRSRLNSR